ncbi:MAG: HD domain-containing protein [Spirochaetota bacterium]
MHKNIPKGIDELIYGLTDIGHTVFLTGITALDLLYNHSPGAVIEIAGSASLIDLSPHVDELHFPGSEGIDAVFHIHGHTCIYRETEENTIPESSLLPLNIYYDVSRDVFCDPHDQYLNVRRHGEIVRKSVFGAEGWTDTCDEALLLARFGFHSENTAVTHESFPPESTAYQLMILMRLLESKDPARGLTHLMETGFIQHHWPLLQAMAGVSQDKDFHPEGDVWQHTMETFSYIKSSDIDLRMALLLHDSGKAFASQHNNNRFDRHAQIGANKAQRFLKELGYPEEHRQRVCYLIRNHMLPAYAPKLPLYRFEQIISSPDYLLLLELFRCDISSSFRDMELYYKACEHYKSFKKHMKNPFRSSDGSRKRQSDMLHELRTER